MDVHPSASESDHVAEPRKRTNPHEPRCEPAGQRPTDADEVDRVDGDEPVLPDEMTAVEETEVEDAQNPNARGRTHDSDNPYAQYAFEDLCGNGSGSTKGEKAGWTKRATIKFWRYCINPCKQIYLYAQTVRPPTNHLMLQFRTYNRDYEVPHANDDYLAPLLRDELMPSRGQAMRNKLPRMKIMHDVTQWPVLGLPGIVNFIDARTQWFDEAVVSALDAGITQVVVVAAGYDTRAYRFGRQGVTFFEIDLPDASRKKQELVQKLIPETEYRWPEFVAADLSSVRLEDALKGTTFQKTTRSLFIVEGLVYYLKPTAVKGLLESISALSAKGSRLQFDFVRLSTLTGDNFNPGFDTMRLSVFNKGERFRSGINHRPEALEVLVHMFGFRLVAAPTAKEQCEKYLKREFKKRPGATLQPSYGYVTGERV